MIKLPRARHRKGGGNHMRGVGRGRTFIGLGAAVDMGTRERGLQSSRLHFLVILSICFGPIRSGF
jgi:hypothetical protein